MGGLEEGEVNVQKQKKECSLKTNSRGEGEKKHKAIKEICAGTEKIIEKKIKR